MKQYNILVFPCGTEIANEIINALSHHKYFKVKLASSAGNSYCNYRDQKINILPFVNDEKFDEELSSIVKIEAIDFIIPAHDDVAFKLSEIEERLNLKVIGQSQEVNEIVRFKDKTYKYFQDILPIADVYENEEELEFPLFVKPKKGQGAQDSFLIQDENAFKDFRKQYKSDEFVWMEFLNDEEYTIDCFSDQGELLYAGGRTRERMTRGISVQSTFVKDQGLSSSFNEFATKISQKLNLHGLWFYQMKKDKNGQLKLLEIGPRVSGTMMLNRSRGVNFIELALFQKIGFDVEVIFNDIEISLGRALLPKYKTNISYTNLYIDFDDTLFLDEKEINTDVMKLIFQSKNEGKKVYLITKNQKNNLAKTLHSFGITQIFDDILHLDAKDTKVNYMKKESLLVDDSFVERKEAITHGHYAFSNDAIAVLIK